MSDKTITEHRIDNGIDTTMTSVDRHEPKTSRIIKPVSSAAMSASLNTPSSVAGTKFD